MHHKHQLPVVATAEQRLDHVSKLGVVGSFPCYVSVPVRGVEGSPVTTHTPQTYFVKRFKVYLK